MALNAPFTYTLTVTNAGSTVATNVVVTDNLPAGINVTYATTPPPGMCSAISGRCCAASPRILPGETVTMTFNAVGTTVGAWTNQASVTAAQVELTPADNVVSEPTMVVGESAVCSVVNFSGPTILSRGSGTLHLCSAAI